MVILALFLVAGGTAYAINRAAPFLLVVGAIVVILWYPFAAIMWINDRTGIENMLVSSWQSLSGVQVPADVYQECGGSSPIPSDTLWGVVLIFLLWVLTAVLVFGNVIIGLGAVVGIPVGAIASGLGAIGSLALRTKEPLYVGLIILSVGLGCMVAAGLVMRIVNFTSGVMC